MKIPGHWVSRSELMLSIFIEAMKSQDFPIWEDEHGKSVFPSQDASWPATVRVYVFHKDSQGHTRRVAATFDPLDAYTADQVCQKLHEAFERLHRIMSWTESELEVRRETT